VFLKFQVGATNPELQKVVDLLPSISHRGEKAVVKEPIDPVKMLPSMCKQMSTVLIKPFF
jgi:carbonic anhydrase